ncbi:MAG: MoxR family ATPase [Actinomycetota bacterium]
MGSLNSAAEVTEALRAHGYVTDDRLATVMYLATALNKPVLVEGPAGVGKTELAKSLAAATGRRLIRLQCYEGQDDTKALYEWDYGKQLLYTQLLREKIDSLLEDLPDLGGAAERLSRHESVFFSEHFLVSRPLLEAIRSDEPAVLLIDEIDRADEHLEALMLEVLAEFQVTIPELGTVAAKFVPYVVITSNNTRELSEALKRRCVHLSLGYPGAARELEILRLKVPGIADELRRQVVDVVRGIRELDLRKSPSISEAIDWARALALLNVASLGRQVVEETLMLILKYDRDVETAARALPRLFGEPEDEGLDRDHGHDHDHRHSHGNGHSHDGPEERYRRHALGYFGAVS